MAVETQTQRPPEFPVVQPESVQALIKAAEKAAENAEDYKENRLTPDVLLNKIHKIDEALRQAEARNRHHS